MGSISHNQVTVSICFKIILYVLVFIISHVDGQNASQQLSITFIADAITKGAVCLDGTPGAYYFSKGFGDGINSWMIFLPGGAWCATNEGCLNKSSTDLGSNKNPPPLPLGTFQSTNKTINPDFYNWNIVQIRYCDGASFMADVEAVNPETNLHLRGRRIFTSVIEELKSTQGMSNAENALLIGNSAGGLATILNCDRFHSFLPGACRVKCISDSGFFIRAEHLRGAQDNAIDNFRKVVLFHELAQFLPESCTQRLAPELCFFPENVVNDIRTPLFLLNSDFDKYQISELVVPNKVDWNNCTAEFSKLSSCTENQQHIIMDFQTTFLETLEKLDDNPSRGLFITSCYVHDFIYKPSNWQRIPTLQNKASFMILFAFISQTVNSHFDICHELNYLTFINISIILAYFLQSSHRAFYKHLFKFSLRFFLKSNCSLHRNWILYLIGDLFI
ncbi:pectin acetylesterase 8-like isoform X2 [Salvia splendens]|uniref:pectin acetylesterase 8-like isoform X2 n=1 Tax=Salvia splendens TaxID=180675 RepID=UPI001C27C6C6|nr:pectin acetylesterase 8-like isoform X2 [Salvia splendens]